jgi:hypothetical protein
MKKDSLDIRIENAGKTLIREQRACELQKNPLKTGVRVIGVGKGLKRAENENKELKINTMYKKRIYKAKSPLKVQSEKELHSQVCQYLKIQYPKVLFNSDMAGAMKLTIGQATQISKLRSNKGFPDIVIYEPRGEYNGMFLELKRGGESLFKKDGDYVTDHIKEQHLCIALLASKGYYATFAIGWDEAREKIDFYLKIE